MKKILALLFGSMMLIPGFSQSQATNVSATTVATPLSNEQFTILLRKVRNHARNSERIQAALAAATDTSNRFNTNQVKMLLESFQGDDQRLTIARMVYDRVTDPQNFTNLSNTLAIQSNKDALAAFILANDRSNVVYSFSESFRTPMTATNFANTLQAIQAQWQEGSRLSSIIDVFDKPGTFFTVTQVKQLIEMISDEGSRLHLAKAAYGKVTDPQNFSQLYDLFDSQERLNSLTNYIGASAHSIQMTHNDTKMGMSEGAFSQAYQDVKDHYRNKSRINSAASFFTNDANFYSSYQAREMILLINGEKNRLKAAKAAYRGVIDPANFMAQMQDLFEHASSRNELQQYVNNFRGV